MNYMRVPTNTLPDDIKFGHLMTYIFTAYLIVCSLSISAEPWLDTRDVWLRADIETLSDVGIISVPITTYPIMWSSIVKDFDNTNIEDVPEKYKSAFWRLKKEIRKAFRKQSYENLRFSAASSTQVFRAFGDSSREKSEISARRYGMEDSWAWNLEATYALDPFDGDNVRLDGSYLAAVWGNWNFSAGYVERWWGPSWDSTSLVSNNARPTPALMLQRNYSDLFDYGWLKWIGPWTLNAFIGSLDDNRVITDANLIGMSVSFKPLPSLEIGLRRSAQWGGEGRPDDIQSFVNMLIGRDNCGSDGISCINDDNEPGNQLAGLDIRWSLPIDIPTTLYFSAIGEDEANYMPAKNIFQLGVSSIIEFGETPWRWYLEYADTAVWNERFNITYEHHIYRTGYRYNGRSIGSTYDNDSRAFVFGIMGRLSKDSSFSVKLKSLKINSDGDFISGPARNTLSDIPLNVNNFNMLWQQSFIKKGSLKINFDYFSEALNSFGRQQNKYRIAVDWTYSI